jgi:ferredoxin--NADP+ reductase
MLRETDPVIIIPAAGPRRADATIEHFIHIRRRTPTLAAFRITRPAAFRFTPGHYARLGLETADGTVIWRPYSIASPSDAGHLDFECTLVPGGPFTERFGKAAAGDAIRLDARSFGFLTLDQVAPGGTLWMFSTGTGVAPFLSMLADARTWERHARVVLSHSVRCAAELTPDSIEASLKRFGSAERARLTMLPVVTREKVSGAFGDRLDVLLREGALERAVGETIEPVGARAMLCGNPEMIREMRSLLRERGLVPGRRGVPGQLSTAGSW